MWAITRRNTQLGLSYRDSALRKPLEELSLRTALRERPFLGVVLVAGFCNQPGRQGRHRAAVFGGGEAAVEEAEEAAPQAFEEMGGGEAILIEERGAPLLERFRAFQAVRRRVRR